MSLPLPQEGSAEYQALLVETGRSDLNGFNLEAHIAATQGPNAPAAPAPAPTPAPAPAPADPLAPPAPPAPPVPVPPPFNPADLTPVAAPPVGSPEYQALLLETGRSDLNGFNYAAHLAAKSGVSNDKFDNYIAAESLSDFQRLLGSTDANQFFAQSSGEQIQQLVNKFGSDPAFAAFLQKQTTPGGGTTPVDPGQTLPPNPIMNGVVINTYQAPVMARNVDTVPLPDFGSVAYKALLLETGRDDLIGFNYGAHLAAKATTSLTNFDEYMNAGSGSALLQMLGQVNVNELMAKASPAQVQQLIGRFATDPSFAAFLDANTTPALPSTGSPAYEALLASTGRRDLTGFDYQAHLRVLTEAQQAVTTANLKDQAVPAAQLVGSASNDRLVYTGQEFVMLAGGEGDDELVAGDNGSLLVPGSGNNKVTGGASLDVVVLSDTLSAANIGKTPEGAWVVQNSVTNSTNQLSAVERLVFEDVSLALDVTPEQSAGQTAMILGAVFGKDAIDKLDYVGIGLKLFDEGSSFSDISALAMSVVNKTSPEDVVGLLWTNVVGTAPTADQARPFVDMLNSGVTPGQLAEMAARTDLNLEQIDLVGLSQTGILFV